MWEKPLELILVDDDYRQAHALADALKANGFAPQVAKTLSAACTLNPRGSCDFLLISYPVPEKIDATQLKMAARALPGVRMIALLPGGNEGHEELLHQSGIHLVLCRELAPRQLAQIMVAQGELRIAEEQNYRLRQMLDGRTAYANLIGGSAPMRSMYRLLDQVARTDAPVLILGEEGTERVEVARAIHQKSERALHSLVAVDCQRAADDLDASAIFGPIGRGLYASGPDPQRSAFAKAGSGVLVLHRIEALPLGGQQRLLDYLHRPFFQNETPGTPHPLARLMVTASPDLLERVENGQFLRELYYRLNILQVRVPPLRERREDVPMLAQHALRMLGRRRPGEGSAPQSICFSSAALLALFQHDWPGNLEEVIAAVEHATQHLQGVQIELEDLPEELRSQQSPAEITPASFAHLALKEAKRQFESEYFLGLLRRTHGNMTLASRFSRVGRPYLYKKIKEYDLNPDEFR